MDLAELQQTAFKYLKVEKPCNRIMLSSVEYPQTSFTPDAPIPKELKGIMKF
jgi:hypothetical protein